MFKVSSAIFAAVVLLEAAACGQNSSSNGDDGSGSTDFVPLAFEECLQENGWLASAAHGALSNRDLAARIAAVRARCQPSDDALEAYAQKLR